MDIAIRKFILLYSIFHQLAIVMTQWAVLNLNGLSILSLLLFLITKKWRVAAYELLWGECSSRPDKTSGCMIFAIMPRLCMTLYVNEECSAVYDVQVRLEGPSIQEFLVEYLRRRRFRILALMSSEMSPILRPTSKPNSSLWISKRTFVVGENNGRSSRVCITHNATSI